MAAENDIVLIYFEDKPLTYARIEEILPDAKPNWYHVRLLLLQFPLQVVTWILRDIYINGGEFTMDGKRMRLERIVAPQPDRTPSAPKDEEAVRKPSREGNVISLKDLKRK
jgi:hypothetical protein